MKKLFIDDLRMPFDTWDMSQKEIQDQLDREGWVVVKTSAEAIDWLKQNGIPEFITFDHDLGIPSMGQYDTVIPIINFIIDSVLNGTLKLPDNFTYQIHSGNPVGRENIKGKLDGFLTFLKDSQEGKG